MFYSHRGGKAERQKLLFNVIETKNFSLSLKVPLLISTIFQEKKPAVNNPPLLSCSGCLDWRMLCAARVQCQECFLLWLFKAAVLLHDLNLTERFWGQEHSSTVAWQFFPDVGEGAEQSFSWGHSTCVMYERRGLATERCLIHKSTGTIFFLHFWPGLKCLLCSCTSHATVSCDILLLLFWPYASWGAGFVLYCWLLSNKIVQQDRLEVQERCRAHLGKNQHWAKCQLMKIQLCSISFNVMT